MAQTNPAVAVLLELIDQAYDRPAWHGPNLRSAVRRVTAFEAAWRPGPGRHSIAELAVHAGYWKYTVRRRITGEKRGSFPLTGSNWIALPQPWDEAAWRGCVQLLDTQHRALREAVAGISPRRLNTTPTGSRFTLARLIEGVACHDVYHAGQIQSIKKHCRQGARGAGSR